MDAKHAQKIANLLQQVKVLTKNSSIELDYRYHDKQLAEFNSVLLVAEPTAIRMPVHCNGNFTDTKGELIASLEKVQMEIGKHVAAIKAM